MASGDVAPATCEVVDDERLRMVLDHLGPDPLRADADDDEVCRRLASDRRSIGEVLLDQTVISGVGNVLRAETLFACTPTALRVPCPRARWGACGEPSGR